MVSKRHEGPIHIIRNNPEVIAHLLRDAFGLVLPEYTSVINGSEEFTQVAPASYRGDNVVLLCGKDPARPSLAVVAETQLKIDSDKPFTWPVYASVLRERKRCDVLLVVFCTRKSVAAWADTSIDLGHSRFQLRPLVIGPGTAPSSPPPARPPADPNSRSSPPSSEPPANPTRRRWRSSTPPSPLSTTQVTKTRFCILRWCSTRSRRPRNASWRHS
ncbi:hypothetical protein ACFQHO_32150 [Actinomadura yumaensis]|uniref:hypothetical protein n=1 Tax=Actinomadura yumaensis TaxID=111807 RepID=UPI00361A1F26